MTTKPKCSGRCKIGKPRPLTAANKVAIKHWESLRGAKATTYVGSLPAPTGAVAMYCMSFWMVAYRTAADIDAKLAILPAQIQAINVCAAQHQV